MITVVNYHYVRPALEHRYSGIHPTLVSELEGQLRTLARHWDFISGRDLRRALNGECPVPDHACLITFDDGLSEQFEYALPVLDSLGIPAVFFCCSLPLTGRALTVHKTHWLQATRPFETFKADLVDAASALRVSLPFDEVDDAAAARQYHYDPPLTRRVKYLLNHVIPFGVYEQLIGEMFRRERDERAFCDELYMDAEQIAELAARQTVGSHAHSHIPLARLPLAEARRELGLSKTALEGATGGPVTFVSYPYGGPTAVSVDVAAAAEEVGYVAGFTTERATNLTLNAPLLFGRFSVGDLPGGTRPLMSWKDGRCVVDPPATIGRRWYSSEIEASSINC